MSATEYLKIWPNVTPIAQKIFLERNKTAQADHLIQIYWESRQIPREIALSFEPLKIHVPWQANLFMAGNFEHLFFVNFQTGEIMSYYKIFSYKRQQLAEHAKQVMGHRSLNNWTVAELLGIPIATQTARQAYAKFHPKKLLADLFEAYNNSVKVSYEDLVRHGFRGQNPEHDFLYDGFGIFVCTRKNSRVITYLRVPPHIGKKFSHPMNARVQEDPVTAEGTLQYMFDEKNNLPGASISRQPAKIYEPSPVLATPPSAPTFWQRFLALMAAMIRLPIKI